jgi:transposase, IS5 family
VVFPVIPKKGELSQQVINREFNQKFKRLRNKHSAVDSKINEIEVHGLDKCPYHGFKGFERYTALAVLANNIHYLGSYY